MGGCEAETAHQLAKKDAMVNLPISTMGNCAFCLSLRKISHLLDFFQKGIDFTALMRYNVLARQTDLNKSVLRGEFLWYSLRTTNTRKDTTLHSPR